MRTEHKSKILCIAAITTWDKIQANSMGKVEVWQGWINGSHITIVKIPYFGLNNTKFIFYILMKFIVDYLRAIICVTTNHNRCCTICYWSMSRSASFEISMKWPVIIFIFGNDWRLWVSIHITSNEKRCLICGCNRVMRILP